MKTNFQLGKKIIHLIYFGRIFKNLRIVFCIFIIEIVSFPNQSIAQNIEAKVKLTPSGSGYFEANFIIDLPNSSGYSDIEVKLIDNLDNTELFDRSFEFDQTTGLPPGITWERNGNQVSLGIGNHPQRIAYVGKVRLKNNNGTWSNWYEFLFN